MSGVKFDKIPSDSFSSPNFIKFSKIPDMVWMDFLVSGLKLQYMRKFKITKIKPSLTFIGDYPSCPFFVEYCNLNVFSNTNIRGHDTYYCRPFHFIASIVMSSLWGAFLVKAKRSVLIVSKKASDEPLKPFLKLFFNLSRV